MCLRDAVITSLFIKPCQITHSEFFIPPNTHLGCFSLTYLRLAVNFFFFNLNTISHLTFLNKISRVFFAPRQLAGCYPGLALPFDGERLPHLGHSLRGCWVQSPRGAAPRTHRSPGWSPYANACSKPQAQMPCTSRGISVFRSVLYLYMKSSRSSSSSSENASGFWTWWASHAFTPPSFTSPSTT